MIRGDVDASVLPQMRFSSRGTFRLTNGYIVLYTPGSEVVKGDGSPAIRRVWHVPATPVELDLIWGVGLVTYVCPRWDGMGFTDRERWGLGRCEGDVVRVAVWTHFRHLIFVDSPVGPYFSRRLSVP